jgi:sulfoacetaldehyde dehydrogenase
MWPDGSHLSPKIVGQSAQQIARVAGIVIPPEVKFLMVLGEAVGSADMFSGEKLSPVMTLWKYDEFDAAVKLVTDITRYSGYGLPAAFIPPTRNTSCSWQLKPRSAA